MRGLVASLSRTGTQWVAEYFNNVYGSSLFAAHTAVPGTGQCYLPPVDGKEVKQHFDHIDEHYPNFIESGHWTYAALPYWYERYDNPTVVHLYRKPVDQIVSICRHGHGMLWAIAHNKKCTELLLRAPVAARFKIEDLWTDRQKLTEFVEMFGLTYQHSDWPGRMVDKYAKLRMLKEGDDWREVIEPQVEELTKQLGY